MLSNSKLNENQKTYVDVITQSGQLLLGVINDILDYSKIEAGKLELEATQFSVNSLIDDVYKLILNQAIEKKISLKFINEESCSVVVLGDIVRLRQVLINLLSNAIKFSQEGEVRLIVKCEQKKNGCKLNIVVEDDGIGISDEDKGRLFTSFMQADNSITRRFGGTGLGLAITEKLVYMMGGKIEVESELGSGSRFIIQLELEAQESEVVLGVSNDQSAEIESKAVNLSSKKLLLVEDNKVNQLVVKSILENTGITIEIVENGKIAVEKVANMDFDIILMDLRMPEMGGIEATKLIRVMYPDRIIPIIALTANVASSDRSACAEVGMDDFMGKPFKAQELLDILRKWLL
jgi:CheY-like chemotaxis protein/two-component sensor histidine kinase